VSEACCGASAGGGTAACRSVAGKSMAAAIELRRGRDSKDIAHVPIEWSSGDKHISRDGAGPSGRSAIFDQRTRFRVPDAVQREAISAFTHIVDALA